LTVFNLGKWLEILKNHHLQPAGNLGFWADGAFFEFLSLFSMHKLA
jgi:hypothetical protein